MLKEIEEPKTCPRCGHTFFWEYEAAYVCSCCDLVIDRYEYQQDELWYSYDETEARRKKYRLLDDRDGLHLPDTNAADMARCVSRLRAHLKPKHLLTRWIFANIIGAGIYLAQLASLHFGGAQ